MILTSRRSFHVLQQAGFEVEAILHGQVAHELLQEATPNVVVLDIHLPHHVDGSTLLKQIHADERLSKVHIILVTADSARAEQYRRMANIVMVKPITFSSLRDISARLKTD